MDKVWNFWWHKYKLKTINRTCPICKEDATIPHFVGTCPNKDGWTDEERCQMGEERLDGRTRNGWNEMQYETMDEEIRQRKNDGWREMDVKRWM